MKLTKPKKPEKQIRIKRVIHSQKIYRRCKPILLGDIELPSGTPYKVLKISARIVCDVYTSNRSYIELEIFDDNIVSNPRYEAEYEEYQEKMIEYDKQKARSEKIEKLCNLLGYKYNDELINSANALDIIFENWNP